MNHRKYVYKYYCWQAVSVSAALQNPAQSPAHIVCLWTLLPMIPFSPVFETRAQLRVWLKSRMAHSLESSFSVCQTAIKINSSIDSIGSSSCSFIPSKLGPSLKHAFGLGAKPYFLRINHQCWSRTSSPFGEYENIILKQHQYTMQSYYGISWNIYGLLWWIIHHYAPLLSNHSNK